jgi:hypothetical protein
MDRPCCRAGAAGLPDQVRQGGVQLGMAKPETARRQALRYHRLAGRHHPGRFAEGQFQQPARHPKQGGAMQYGSQISGEFEIGHRVRGAKVIHAGPALIVQGLQVGAEQIVDVNPRVSPGG